MTMLLTIVATTTCVDALQQLRPEGILQRPRPTSTLTQLSAEWTLDIQRNFGAEHAAKDRKET